MHSLIVAALLTLSKNHLLKDENGTDLSRYVTKSFRSEVQRNGCLTRTCTKKLRANARGKSSRKACSKTPPRSARTKGRKSNGHSGWFFGLFMPHSLSLSLVPHRASRSPRISSLFFLAGYIYGQVCPEVFNSRKFDQFFKNSPYGASSR